MVNDKISLSLATVMHQDKQLPTPSLGDIGREVIALWAICGYPEQSESESESGSGPRIEVLPTFSDRHRRIRLSSWDGKVELVMEQFERGECTLIEAKVPRALSPDQVKAKLLDDDRAAPHPLPFTGEFFTNNPKIETFGEQLKFAQALYRDRITGLMKVASESTSLEGVLEINGKIRHLLKCEQQVQQLQRWVGQQHLPMGELAGQMKAVLAAPLAGGDLNNRAVRSLLIQAEVERASSRD